ncbi:hypothetical protein GDO86_002670, partial [Hymenochirus boettgeri]
YKVSCLVAVALILGPISSANGYVFDEHCAIQSSARINCGYPGISSTQCIDIGCCYDSNADGPWCYYNKKTVDEHCAIQSSARINCGYPGISSTQCIGIGCCYDSNTDGPWCFYNEKTDCY